MIAGGIYPLHFHSGGSMGFSTDAIHVGQEPDPLTGSIVAPIYQTSTYVLEEMGKDKGYDYARTNHPNRKALERTVAKLEGGHAAYVFTSGMAAIDAVFRLLRPGEHTILSQAVYGGVFRLTTKLLVDFGLEFSYVDTSCLKKIEEAIKPNTRMIYVETPTNPTMIVTDLAAVGRICKARNLTFVVDNTFLSPYLQRPIEFGADIVVHSMTKYLNGHSDWPGRGLRRWIAFLCRAGSRRSPCGWTGITRTAWRWRSFSSRIRR